jgi:hypothetical protein
MSYGTVLLGSVIEQCEQSPKSIQNGGDQRFATLRDPLCRILSRVRCIAWFADRGRLIIAPRRRFQPPSTRPQGEA